jgi:hypothetical protein
MGLPFKVRVLSLISSKLYRLLYRTLLNYCFAARSYLPQELAEVTPLTPYPPPEMALGVDGHPGKQG